MRRGGHSTQGVDSIMRTYLCRDAISRTVYFQLEGICSDHPVQLPVHLKAVQKLKQVIMGFIQIPFSLWQAGGTNHLSRDSVPVLVLLHHDTSTIIFSLHENPDDHFAPNSKAGTLGSTQLSACPKHNLLSREF